MAAKVRSAKAPVSSARAKRVAKSARSTARHRPDADLDFTEVPELTDTQLKRARRAGRPSQGMASKHLIAIRIDPVVLAALRRLANQKKIGYQTLIQNVLTEAVRPRSPTSRC